MKNPLGSPLSVTQNVTHNGRARGWRGRLKDEQVRRAKLKTRPYSLSDGHGLHVLVRPSGAKVWYLSYRAGGIQRKIKLGEYPAVTLARARVIAAEKLGEIASGRDPAEAKRRAKVAAREASETFSHVLSLYIAQHVEKLRTAYAITRVLTREFESRWGDRPLADVTRKEIRRAIDEIEARAPVMALSAYVYLSGMMRWAVEREHISQHPMAGMKPPAGGQDRDRVLTDLELRQIWSATETVSEHYRDVVRLLILTGARRSEISDIDWSEVDLDGRRLVLPRERMKAGEGHTIPLSDAALAILMGLPGAAERSGRVFPHIGHWARRKGHLDAKLPGMPAWVLHDLRRTVASGLQRLGTLPVVIERCLGHAVGGERGGGIRKVYQRYRYDREARQALELWAAHVDRVLSGKVPTVVALR